MEFFSYVMLHVAGAFSFFIVTLIFIYLPIRWARSIINWNPAGKDHGQTPWGPVTRAGIILVVIFVVYGLVLESYA